VETSEKKNEKKEERKGKGEKEHQTMLEMICVGISSFTDLSTRHSLGGKVGTSAMLPRRSD
jgi:hypothetical protein